MVLRIFTWTQGAAAFWGRSFVFALATFLVIVVVLVPLNVPGNILGQVYPGSRSWFAMDLGGWWPPFGTLLAAARDYGAHGRSVVIVEHATFDLAFLLTFTSLIALGVKRCLQHMHLDHGQWRHLIWVPAAGGAFDFAENVMIVLICIYYRSSWVHVVAAISGWLTLGKFAGYSIGLATWLYLIVRVFHYGQAPRPIDRTAS
jgi:hypothetical protein